MNKYAVIITGGGSSTRYGERNKLLEPLCGAPVFIHSVRNFARFADRENFILTVSEKDRSLFEAELDRFRFSDRVTVVTGGSTRVESVRNALDALTLKSGRVAIHDAARPLASAELLEQLFSDEKINVIAASKVVDSIKTVTPDGKIASETDRTYLWKAETPQVFDLPSLKKAFENAPADATDDASIMRHAGFDVYVFENTNENLKLTSPQDLPKLENILKMR
ncbi:MAG: 2-C-methyl-D-erythritol 4-phosphate cytidylyltransferase [Lentisphaeria bacterium]|nr:2-C-methyl-D-erythritol 4-phosphate cytidylyltransferase [Lentisphaeria bacterium]